MAPKNNPLIVVKKLTLFVEKCTKVVSYQMKCLVKLKNRIMLLKSLDDSTTLALYTDILFFGQQFVVLLRKYPTNHSTAVSN